MTRKHMLVVFAIGVLVGYVAQNYIRKIPVVNKLPTPGGA